MSQEPPKFEIARRLHAQTGPPESGVTAVGVVVALDEVEDLAASLFASSKLLPVEQLTFIDGLLRNDLVVLDELGFAPLDATGSQLLFRFVAAAYEQRSLAIGTHWPFDQWGRFIPDQSAIVSMVDRLLHHATVVVTEGESFRMREAKARGGVRSK